METSREIKELRKGIAKLTVLNDDGKTQFKCTYSGLKCKNFANYVVECTYKNAEAEWVCMDHLVWGINEIENKFRPKKPAYKPREYVLEHDIHFEYVGSDLTTVYECNVTKKKGMKSDECYGSRAVWKIALKHGNFTSEDKRFSYISCSHHFRPAIKKIIRNADGHL